MNATFFQDDWLQPNMTGTQESFVTPFRVIADVREEAGGWRFEGLSAAGDPARMIRVPIEYRYLDLADYTVEGLSLFLVRKQATEFARAMQQWPQSVCEELAALRDLQATGASCLVVIEGSEREIEQVLQIDDKLFAQAGRGVPWLFAPSRGVAEMLVFAVIQRAWQRSIRGG